MDLGVLDNAFSLFPSRAWYSEVVFQLKPASASLEGLLNTDAWAPSPEFLIHWVWRWPQEFAFLRSFRVLLLQVQRSHAENQWGSHQEHGLGDQATRLSIPALLFTTYVIMGHLLTLSVPPFPHL